jgi:lipopolysaccharide export system permease protein
VLPLLVSGQVKFGIVAEAVGLLVPFVWVFALPMGMLTATLLIFGRFSADQELTAVRASGVSLLSLVSPILLLSIALCVLSALVNMEIGPRCRVLYTRLLFRVRTELTSAQLPEGRMIKGFKDVIFYIGKNRGGKLQDVMLYQYEKQTNPVMIVHAPRGALEQDVANKRIFLHLYDAKALSFNQGNTMPAGGDVVIQLDTSSKEKKDAPNLSDMTFSQLWAELQDLERRIKLPPPKDLTSAQMRELRLRMIKEKADLTSPVRVHIHRQVAFSFACFGFTLVGIPLGIRVHRRETNVGVGIALLLVAAYYSFILLGQSLDTKPQYAPQLIVWLPNFVFQAVGAVLLYRANKGV